jgi:hypothetical protein
MRTSIGLIIMTIIFVSTNLNLDSLGVWTDSIVGTFAMLLAKGGIVDRMS